MPSYKLIYFDGRGAGECARQLFVLADVPFEDVRYTEEQWPEIKPKTPFGQLPVLEVDGKPLPQSAAIARYLAKQFGYAGKDDFEAAWVDAICDQYKDYYGELAKYYYVVLGFVEGDKEKLRKEFGEPARDKFFPLLVKQLKSNGSGFLVGDALTWIDLLIADHMASLAELFPGWVDAYPELIAHSAKVRATPAIKKWIETRPETPY